MNILWIDVDISHKTAVDYECGCVDESKRIIEVSCRPKRLIDNKDKKDLDRMSVESKEEKNDDETVFA